MAVLTPSEKLALALNDPHLVTVGGLNKVYRYLMSRISGSTPGGGGSAIYKVRGSVSTFDKLIKLDQSEFGDIKFGSGMTEGYIYNVVGKDQESVTGANYVCIKKYNFIRIEEGSTFVNKVQTIGFVRVTDPTETSPMSGRTYYTSEDDSSIVLNPQPDDNPYVNGWYYKAWVVHPTITEDNISDKSNWSQFWDSFGGSQPKATYSDASPDKKAYGVVLIGDGIAVSTQGVISANVDNRTILFGSGSTVEEHSIYIPPATSSTLGVVKPDGQTIQYVTTGSPAVSTGEIYARTADNDNVGVVSIGDYINVSDGVISIPNATDASGGFGVVKPDKNTIKVKTSGSPATSTGEIYAEKATASTLGVVNIGSNIDVTSAGVISVHTAESDKLGAVKAGSYVNVSDGVISIPNATKANNGFGVVKPDNSTISVTLDSENKSTGEITTRKATGSLLGVVKIGNNIDVTSAGVISVHTAESDKVGAVTVGENINVSSGTISISPASASAYGVVQPDDKTIKVNSTGEIYALAVVKNGTDPGLTKIGDNIDVDANGVISVPKATKAKAGAISTGTIGELGVVQIGTNINVNDNGVISVDSLHVGTDSDTTNIVTINGEKSTDAAPTSSTSPLHVNGDIFADGNILGNKVFNAVWNDISDAIEVQDDLEVEPGYCYMFDGKTYKKTEEYCQKGILGIHSDTAGSILGRKGKHKELDIAIGGFVLAHIDKEYESGTPLTSGPNGYLTRMYRDEVREYPERLVAVYWKPETEEFWGPEGGQIRVNGRHWVKVK